MDKTNKNLPRSAADSARLREVRDWFDRERPSLDDLLASGDYTEPFRLTGDKETGVSTNTAVSSNPRRADDESMSRAKPRQRWFYFLLAGLLVAAIIGAAGLIASYSQWRSQQQSQQRAAAKAVEALGGHAQHIFSSFSPWARYMESADAPNLFLLNSKKVTDDDLIIFESAPTTRGLHLFDNRITDDGLVHLKNLPALDFLDLRRNNITDAGLKHLEHHKNLKDLYLIGTQVTPRGVQQLQKKLPNTKIAH